MSIQLSSTVYKNSFHPKSLSFITIITDESELYRSRNNNECQEWWQRILYLFHEFEGFISTIKAKLHMPQDQMQDAYADALVKLLRNYN